MRGPRDLAGGGVALAKSIQKEVNASSIVRERDGRRVPVVVKALRKARQVGVYLRGVVHSSKRRAFNTCANRYTITPMYV